MQRRDGGPAADPFAVAGKDEVGAARARRPGSVQVDEADRLLGRPAVGAGDARDRDGDVRAQPLPRARRHRDGGLSRDGPVLLEDAARDAQLHSLDLVRIGHDPAQERATAAWHRREALRHHPAGAGLCRGERETLLAARIEDELLDAALVATEQVALERLDELRRELVRALLRPRLDVEVDVDLEVARADGRLDPVAVAAGVRERLRDGRLARAEEPEQADIRRLRARQHAPYGLGLDRLAPQSLQLPRRPGQHDDHTPVGLEHETRRRPREAERQRALGNRRLLLHAGLEVDVWTVHPPRECPRDPADLLLERFVDAQTDAGCARDQLDGAVVVGRAEPAGRDAHVGVQPFPQGVLQLALAIADDDDSCGLDPAVEQLLGEEGTVQVPAVAAYELAAGDDDDSARGPTQRSAVGELVARTLGARRIKRR